MIDIVPMSAPELEAHLRQKSGTSEKLPGQWRSRIIASPESLFFSRSVANATLGLSAEVRASELLNLFKGQTPNGKVALLSESQTASGPAGWLIRATSPESLAFLWGLAPRKAKAEMLSCHEASMGSCLDDIEQFVSEGEKSKSNDRGILFAMVPSPNFLNSLPQLRTEVFLPNLIVTVGGACARLTRAPDFLKPVAHWSALHDSRVCELLKDHLGLEFHRELGRPPEVIGLSPKLSQPLTTPENKEVTTNISEKLSAKRFAAAAQEYGWGKSNAADLLKLARGRKVDFKRLKEWKEERIEETKRRKKIEEKEKPKMKNLWRKNTLTHSY